MPTQTLPSSGLCLVAHPIRFSFSRLIITSIAFCLSLYRRDADTLLPGVGDAGPGPPASDLSGFLVLAGGRKTKISREFGSCSWSLIAAMSNTLLRIYPSELKIPLEFKKQNSSCIELFNKTDQRVAFKVKTTNPSKYAVRPASGIIKPGGSCGIIVTMRAPKEMPSDYQCKDKFLVQSIVVDDVIRQKDIVPEMFRKAPGKVVEEFKLRVVYIPANPPSPVPEEAEEENESLDSDVDYEVERPSTSNAASKHEYTSGSQSSHHEDVSMVSKSEDEDRRYADENRKLQEELILLQKRVLSSPAGGFPAAFVLLVFLLSFLYGYLMLGSKA